jgi:type I restriction enzyme S subunit
MSSNTKTTATKEEATPALVPKLRFPEFRETEGWESTQLQKIARPVTDRAVTGDGDNVLSLSGEHGLVLQSDYFGKKVAGDNAERYLKLLRNDFVYNDRTTKASTFGTIKRLAKYDGGIVSPIYKCFRFQGDENPIFWEWYFESGTHDAALRSLVNEGARAGRFNISITQFLSTAAPRPDEAEQQKIAECLSSVDELIAAQARKLDALKTHKKGLMQQLFPREGETQPRLRFPEFQNAEEWAESPLSNFILSLDAGVSVNSGDSRPANKTEFGVLKTSAITKGQFEPEENKVVLAESELSRLKEPVSGGTIIMCRKNTPTLVGANAYVEASHENLFLPDLLWAAKPREGVSMRFLAFILSSDKGRTALSKLAKGSSASMSNITKPDVLAFSVMAPSPPEQQRIADCLTSLDDLIAEHTQKLEALKTHKQGLMQQLFPSPSLLEP